MADQKDRAYLHAQVDTIMNDLLQLIDLATKSPADFVKINNVIKDVQANARGLRDEVNGILSISQLSQGQVLELSALAPVLQTLNPTGGASDRPNLDDFLLNVGSSLIKAQQSLNQQSKQYSEAAAVDFKGLVPPTQFLIPSVKGEMTIGINEVTAKTLNLVFIKDSETKSNFVTSKISFDLSAAPPPPGASLSLTPFLLLQNRLDFLTELERIPEVATALQIANSKHFGVVFAVPKESTTGQQDSNVFLIVYLVQDIAMPILNPQWKSIVLVAAQQVNGQLQLYNKLLEATDSNPLAFPRTSSAKVTSFGDALMQIVAAVYMWMSSLGIPPEVS
jgi:hypothetical protein